MYDVRIYVCVCLCVNVGVLSFEDIMNLAHCLTIFKSFLDTEGE